MCLLVLCPCGAQATSKLPVFLQVRSESTLEISLTAVYRVPRHIRRYVQARVQVPALAVQRPGPNACMSIMYCTEPGVWETGFARPSIALYPNPARIRPNRTTGNRYPRPRSRAW
ncbi:hypothetical protein BDW75DRAFT_213025 [Aspergillus navahoensis]